MYACITCGKPSATKYCDICGEEGKRPSRSARGYTSEFERNRATLLVSHPLCDVPGCNKLATVADHEPPRKKLVANGANNPDALIWLKAKCGDCHSNKTNKGR